jgi:uncharacterized membrane protein YphA (DoxX/SURF4 family)
MAFFNSRLFRLIFSVALAALILLLCPPCFNRLHLLAILGGVVLMVNLDMIFKRIPILTHLCRIAVGGLFIFSGFIKANDPVGFSYKLEEYFEVFGQGFSCDMKVANPNTIELPCSKEKAQVATVQAPLEPSKFWHFFKENSLLLAIILVAVEMVLGVFLLLGFQTRWTLWLLLAMIVFFSFLTFYSACCNKVTSCGCFGDAIKLTPWESFWKDLILLLLITLLMVTEQHIKPLFRNTIVMAGAVGIFTFISFAIPVYTYRHMPIIDFRPYKIGENWWKATQQKTPQEDKCVNDSTEMRFYYYHNQDSLGPYREFGMDSFPDSTWTFYCRYDKLIRKGNCEATIRDFNIADTDSMFTHNDSLLQMKGMQFYLVMYDLEKTDYDVMAKVNAFYADCQKKGIPFNALVAASNEKIAAYRKRTEAQYPIYVVDQTALKTVIRSNPGLILLKDGVSSAMWHSNDFPYFNHVFETYK